MEEIFMPIENYPNYAVSNKGNVMNISNKKIINNWSDFSQGYVSTSLSKDGKKKTFKTHRLVALAFIDNPEKKPYVNHIDGNKSNNEITNLEWVTAQENTLHAQENNLKSGNKPIVSTNIENGYKKTFYSIGECADYFNTNKGSIHRVLSGKRNKSKGHKFEYIRR